MYALREHSATGDVTGLARSIEALGLLQPIGVTDRAARHVNAALDRWYPAGILGAPDRILGDAAHAWVRLGMDVDAVLHRAARAWVAIGQRIAADATLAAIVSGSERAGAEPAQ